MSGVIRPTGRPAQQLMEMLWVEEDGLIGWAAPIYAHTRRLLALGYVHRDIDGLNVYLSKTGREVAQTLSATADGQRYKASLTLPTPEPTP